jgi:predicted P-loop ATPase
MSIMQGLVKLGVSASVSNILDNYYANVDEAAFMDGIEQIAQEVAGVAPAMGLLPPTIEPWRNIHMTILANGKLPDEALLDAIKPFENTLQNAIADAVMALVTNLKNWYQQQSSSHKKRKTHEYLRALKNLGYKFRMNLCNDELEINGEPITDALRAVIRGQMRDANIWEVNVVEDVYLAEGWKNRYHPVKDYLMSITWDGNGYIEELANHFQDEYGMFNTWLRRWLIGCVAKVLDGRQNRMLVMDGPQGIGKSHFAKWVASPIPNYFIEAPINTEDKDIYVRLAGKWIWEVSELGSTTKRADREALKAFLTTHEVTVRKAYARYDLHKPAMASFIGTVNNEGSGILNDPTGNRRFMISKITSIDWNYANMNIHLIWSEAVAAHLRGERGDLTAAEAKEAGIINEQYEMEDYLEDAMRKYFSIHPGNKMMWTSTVDIINVLASNGIKWGTTKAAAMAVATAATKLGLVKSEITTNNKRLRGYFGIQ